MNDSNTNLNGYCDPASIRGTGHRKNGTDHSITPQNPAASPGSAPGGTPNVNVDGMPIHHNPKGPHSGPWKK